MERHADIIKGIVSFLITASMLHFVMRRAKLYEVHSIRGSTGARGNFLQSHQNHFPPEGREHSPRPQSVRPIRRDMYPVKPRRHSNQQPCRQNDGDSVIMSCSNLRDSDSWVKIMYHLSLVYNILQAIKYSLICLLDMGALQEYRYLDCLLLGRVGLNPRVVDFMKYAALCVIWFHCLHHGFVFWSKPNYKFHCLEFLMMNPQDIRRFMWHSDVMKFETDHGMRASSIKCAIKRCSSASKIHSSDKSSPPDESRGASYQYCSLLSYKNSLDESDDEYDVEDYDDWENCDGEANDEENDLKNIDEDEELDSGSGRSLQEPPVNQMKKFPYNIRPNRTLKAWRLFALVVVIHLTIVSAFFIITATPATLMAFPLLITNKGFESNYHICLEWISSQQDRERWKFIYDVPQNYSLDPSLRQALVLPVGEDLIQFNAFHTLRLLWELIENLTFIVQVSLSFSLTPMTSFIIITDVCYYCYQLEAKLTSIIEDYHETLKKLQNEHFHSLHLPPIRFQHSPDYYDPSTDHPLKLAPNSYELGMGKYHDAKSEALRHFRVRIADAQATVIDLFNLIKDYNQYTVPYITFIIIIWYTYSAVCSSWLFLPESMQKSKTMESYLIQASATLFMVVIVGAYSTSRAFCAHLYRQIATVTSLHELDEESRKRWTVIMKHYKPIPLYCFTIFRSTEISWLFAMKLTAWLASALFITTTFSVYLK